MMFLQFHKSPLFLKIIFIISIAIIFFIGGITFKHITVLKKSSDFVSKSHEVNTELERLVSFVKDAETGQRGFLLTKDKNFLEPYLKSKILVKKSFNKISQLTQNSRTQQANLKKLLFYINKRQNYLSKSIYLTKDKNYNKNELAKNLSIGRKTMDSIRSKIEDMMITEKILLINRQQEYISTMNYTPLLIYLTLIITLVLITFAFLKMNGDLVLLKKTINTLTVANEASNLAEIVGDFGSWQFNLETETFTFSDNEYRLLGCEPQSFTASAEAFFQFIHPDDLQHVKDNSVNVQSEVDLPPFTYRIIRKDGQIRYFRALARVVTVSSGERTQIGTTSDVTSEVQAKQLMEQRNRDLESNNKELMAFNYIASHDLQEPLRKIETFLSRLVSKDYQNLSLSGQQYVTSIQSSAKRMRVLIDDLLQFSRTNKAEKIFEKTDLNTVLSHVLQELAPTIEEKKANITSEELPVFDAIPFQIQQLFTNLIGNSLKYSKENTAVEIKITATTCTVENEENLPDTVTGTDWYYKIKIHDNGIGFEQEYANKIFILFNRLHNKNEYAGTGIGLAICKKIIENHQGFITANATLNEGATFTLYFPILS
ncbi:MULTISPECIES: CHASE3 domain-containing protein [unclassified Flavobacterium]|uniref:sensor histidine kinase n=1 Tax=unclassified Flavobacterium TaxID=196869 RepID=UPI00131AD171|nr:MULTISPECIES: CHASE3 domain-containing protein [unclassified Flavobacterium]